MSRKARQTLMLLLQPRGSVTPFRSAKLTANDTMAGVGGRSSARLGGIRLGSRLTTGESEIAAISSSRRARVRCRKASARSMASARVVARPISASSASNRARPTGSP